MPADDLVVEPGVVIPSVELIERFSRSAGPGGQNVNKRSTRVEIVFDVRSSEAIPPDIKRRALRRLASRLDTTGTLRVTASAARTQSANRAEARARLAEILEGAFRPPPPPRRPTKPSKAANERRIAGKRRRSTIKRARRVSPDEE